MTEHEKGVPLRLFGCLIKGPLGCLAFFVGAAVVFVIFLPPACGNLVSGEMESWFAARYQGTLDVKEAWVGSLYGPQRIESVVLRDPSGDQIFHARVTAPSFEGLFFAGGGSWGPIEIDVPSVKLVHYADGTSNMDRALTLREGVSRRIAVDVDSRGDKISIGSFSYDGPVASFLAHATIDRLTWTAASGEELVIRSIDCDAELAAVPQGTRFRLEGSGVLPGGRPEGLRFQLVVDSLESWSDPERFVPWTLAIELREAPVLLVEALAGRVGGLGDPLGETIDSLDLNLVALSTAERRLSSFELRSESAAASARGRWDRERALLTADAGDIVRIGFPTESWWTREVVAPLLPLMDEVELVSSNGHANLELEDFSIPLEGELLDLDAHCTIRSDWVAYALPPAIRQALLIERSGRRSAPLVFELAGGVVHYAQFPVSTEKGDLEVRGELDLRENEYGLIVTAPDGKEYTVQGPRAEPKLARVRED